MLKHSLIFLFLSSSLFYVTFGAENPFTPKASALRYWSLKIPNNLPKPSFLLAKLSPLSAQNSAILQKLADQNALSTQLPSFCSWAHLFCFPDLAPSLTKHDGDSNFAKYSERNFTNYGTHRIGGSDTFKNYSDGINIPNDSFQRYSRDSIGHTEKFANYAPDTNVASGEFNSYGGSATGGSGQFANYDRGVNVPDLKFSNYDSDGLGRPREFISYSDAANAGDQRFTSYGKRANAIPTTFTSYGNNSNVVGSTFLKYGESGNAANDTFTSYGFAGNVPENTFRSYGDGGNAAADTFTSYRDTANVGDDKFTSYAKGATFAKANFVNYGNSANIGSDTFTGYGRDGTGQHVGFKIYGENVTFKDYAKKGISFAKYRNSSSLPSASHWHVEEGKFFRESNLRSGTVMKMPDISDKMPARSFLPRSISQKIPFTTTRVAETLKIFNSDGNSTMADIVGKTLKECEREPSRGETKRCVASAEDMIDFAVEVLGRNLTAKSTEGLGGSKRTVQIGTVTGINGGKITKSVSCHQSLFPYLVYFCHSVPKVRGYEAEILDQTTKKKINRGVAICHIDTSAWGASHAAFIAVGGGPGKVEVCHWIFENDLTWATAD